MLGHKPIDLNLQVRHTKTRSYCLEINEAKNDVCTFANTII